VFFDRVFNRRLCKKKHSIQYSMRSWSSLCLTEKSHWLPKVGVSFLLNDILFNFFCKAVLSESSWVCGIWRKISWSSLAHQKTTNSLVVSRCVWLFSFQIRHVNWQIHNFLFSSTSQGHRRRGHLVCHSSIHHWKENSGIQVIGCTFFLVFFPTFVQVGAFKDWPS